MISHLNTCHYGLNDAARQFYRSVKEALLKLTCTQATLDPAMFFYYQGNKLCGILICHVDDFLHAFSADAAHANLNDGVNSLKHVLFFL